MPLERGRPIEPIQRELRDITTLYNIGITIGSKLSLRDVLRTIYKESGRLLDTTSFAIAIYDLPSDSLSFGLAYDQDQAMKPFAVRYSTSNKATKQVVEQNGALLFPDLAETSHRVEMTREQQIRAWLGVPIANPTLQQKTAQGAIVLWSYQPNQFSDHDLWLASAIGTQAAIAIRNARLYEASQRRAKELMVLNHVAQALSSTLSLDKVLTRIMTEVEDLLNAEAGSLLLTDPHTGDLVFQIALGDKSSEVKPFRVPRGQGIAGEVAKTGKPLLIEDVGRDKRHFRTVDLKTDFLTRNMLCVPLLLQNEVIGVLQVMNKRVGNFNKHDLDLLVAIGSYASIAIQNARLHQHVMAERDRVIMAEEAARKELARDLHDGPTQLVAGIMMSLDFSLKAWKKDRSLIPNELREMHALAARASHQMRTLLFELRPLVLETSGLQPALEVFLKRRQTDIQSNTQLVLNVQTLNSGNEFPRLETKTEAAIFAIVQETVNNALKHAQANQIQVTLYEDIDSHQAIIEDNGIGFDVGAVLRNYEQRGSLGMINLRERTEAIGGELTIKSTVGEGSRFKLIIPKAEEMRHRQRMVTSRLSMRVQD